MKKTVLVLLVMMSVFVLNMKAAQSFVIADFESDALGTSYTTATYNPGEAVNEVVANPLNSAEKSLHVTITNYDARISFPVTLPAGKTLENYETLKFDVYVGSTKYGKEVIVQIDNGSVYKGVTATTSGGQWTTNEVLVANLGSEVGALSSFTLNLGLNGNDYDYYLDNVRLVERTVSSIIADFESDALGTSYTTATYNAGDAVNEVVADPLNPAEKSLHVTITNYDARISFLVTLPAGKTLENYESLKFDAYAGSTKYGKEIIVQIDNGSMYKSQTAVVAGGKWTTNEVLIANLGAEIGTLSSFTLNLGLNGNDYDYYLDNILLVEKTAPASVRNPLAGSIYFSNNILYLSGQANAIQIYDLNGRVQAGFRHVSSIDLSSLAAGVYIAKATVNGQTQVIKIVK